MTNPPIDVWDVATFDEDLLDVLKGKSDLIRDYYLKGSRFASEFLAFTESMIPVMQTRTIRGWHYTRLLGSEVERIRSGGIQLSTIETLRAKLDALVESGELSRPEADQLFAGSPMHGNQFKARCEKFWMTSQPYPVDYLGVIRLLSHWGGEVVAFWQRNPELLRRLSTMGVPRVLEVAVPLALTTKAYSAGNAVVATFARTLGRVREKMDFDVCAISPLPKESVLNVHSEGDPIFAAIGRGYPERYVEIGQ